VSQAVHVLLIPCDPLLLMPLTGLPSGRSPWPSAPLSWLGLPSKRAQTDVLATGGIRQMVKGSDAVADVRGMHHSQLGPDRVSFTRTVRIIRRATGTGPAFSP
jgi:hypothetical protein